MFNNQKQLEDIAVCDIYSRSIFQQPSTGGSKFIMHDFVNDFFGSMGFWKDWTALATLLLFVVILITRKKIQIFDMVGNLSLRTFLPILLHDGALYTYWVDV